MCDGSLSHHGSAVALRRMWLCADFCSFHAPEKRRRVCHKVWRNFSSGQDRPQGWGQSRARFATPTLAFVALSEEGERTFSFARKPGADTQLRPEELRRDVIENSRVFHVGSLSLTDEPARSATIAALDVAKAFIKADLRSRGIACEKHKVSRNLW